jgi:GTP-binding protein
MVLYAVIDTLDAEKAARLEAARRKVEPNWAP